MEPLKPGASARASVAREFPSAARRKRAGGQSLARGQRRNASCEILSCASVDRVSVRRKRTGNLPARDSAQRQRMDEVSQWAKGETPSSASART
eukprot:7779011-Alexandrium_andersonii.AAC.1